MFAQQGRWRQWIEALAQQFREKGATSPEKALTPQDLGVHERFEQAMKRRLGQTGIFVAVGEKYYLNEDRLREFEQRWQSGGGGYGGMWRPMGGFFSLRILRMILGTVIILLFVINFVTGRSWDLWYLIIVLAVIWIIVSVFQISYLARGRGAQFR
jgi:hypothetical protein